MDEFYGAWCRFEDRALSEYCFLLSRSSLRTKQPMMRDADGVFIFPDGRVCTQHMRYLLNLDCQKIYDDGMELTEQEMIDLLDNRI